ncbi:MAG: hypothetical protein ABIQ70_13565 [Dokdonella sp.]
MKRNYKSDPLVKRFAGDPPAITKQSHRVRAATTFVAMALGALTLFHGTLARANAYAFDTTGFNAPHGFVWGRFGNGGNAYGRSITRLANGDTLVASLGPPCNGADQSNGMFNVGIERFSASGQHLTFPNAGSSCGGDIAYPDDAASTYQYIRDIKDFNGTIYVMVDYAFSSTDEDSHILSFHEDGSFVQAVRAFQTTMSEFGASLVPYQDGGGNNFITAVATVYAPGAPHIRLTNFKVNANGILSQNTGYGTNGFADESVNTCIQPHPCFSGAARAVAKQYSNLAPAIGPDIYIVGEIQWNVVSGAVQDFNAIVMDVHANGSLNGSFGTGENPGVAMVAFNEEDQFEDHGHAIAVAPSCAGNCLTDDIWIVDEARTHCGIAVGVAKLDDAGHFVTSFGTGGELVFGGQLGAPLCGGTIQEHPEGLVFDGARLGIVGFEARHFGASFFVDPILAVVDAAEGGLIDFRTQPFFNLLGGNPPLARWGDGSLFDVMANGDGTFTAAGQVHDDFFNVWNFAAARFGNDSIFANGFE